MSKLAGKCDNVISDTTDNLPYKGEIISDQDWEAVWGAISQLPQANVDQRSDKITGIRIGHSRDVYECTKCGRLWVERSPGTNEFVSYSPDSHQVEHVLCGTPK